MANTYAFKSVTVDDIGTSPVDVLTMPAGKNAVIIGFNIANKLGTDVEVDISVTKAGSGAAATLIGNNIEILANGSQNVFDTMKHVLEAGDKLSVFSDTATSVDVVLSYLEETVA